MIGNILCWVIALALILSDTVVAAQLYTKVLLALGFIFVGVLSKAVDVYHDVHRRYIDAQTGITKNENCK
jgi:hypothetical protein